MGSRAVVLVCQDDDVAYRRFGIRGGGAVYTRTGRPFFSASQNAELLADVRTAAAGLFEELGSGWLLLDAELLPWSAKEQRRYDAFWSIVRRVYPRIPRSLRALPAHVAMAEFRWRMRTGRRVI